MLLSTFVHFLVRRLILTVSSGIKLSINSFALTYINDVAALMDTINFNKAIYFYKKYKETYRLARPNFNFNEQEIQFNNSLAGIYEEKFDNNPIRFSEYIDKSIALYGQSLKMDSLNYSANYNLGIIYHNHGVSVI